MIRTKPLLSQSVCCIEMLAQPMPQMPCTSLRSIASSTSRLPA